MPCWGASEMTTAEWLIDEIMAASRIPSEGRRREVLRELRAHVEDFVSAGRQSGRCEEDIERLLLERFGDPRQIARCRRVSCSASVLRCWAYSVHGTRQSRRW